MTLVLLEGADPDSCSNVTFSDASSVISGVDLVHLLEKFSVLSSASTSDSTSSSESIS